MDEIADAFAKQEAQLKIAEAKVDGLKDKSEYDNIMLNKIKKQRWLWFLCGFILCFIIDGDVV